MEETMKTVLVTGGSRGIGKCIVENLAIEGYNVVLNYNKSVKEAKQIKQNLKEKGINIEIYKADVSKREEVKKLVKFTLNKFGNIDVLINNAGIAKLQMFNDITDEDWNEMLGTNLNSAFFTIHRNIHTGTSIPCGYFSSTSWTIYRFWFRHM